MLNLTMEEAERYKVISEVESGYLRIKEAGELLDLSERQVYRIEARIRKGEVVHKSKGKKAPLGLTERIRDRVDHFYKTRYRGFNLTHMTEFLKEEERIRVSRESVRHILLERGSYAKQRRHPQHRQRRESCSREGRMVPYDTSDHDWLEGRGPRLYLIKGVDDATSKVAGAKFVLTDGVKQNMEVFWDMVRRRGIPLSVYVGGRPPVWVDRGSNFKTTRHEGMEYQLKGEYPVTQFARALEEMGVKMIYANSPQAKGRIERKFGVFQDRLCSEFRLHNISTLKDANCYLGEKFIPQHNRMFARSAKECGSAYRQIPKGIVLKDVFCLKVERVVAGDNTISYQGKAFQIRPNEYRLSYCKAKVEVHEYMDGSISILYPGKKLKHKPISKQKTKSFNSFIEPKESELVTMNY